MSLIWTQASLEPKRKFRFLIDIVGDANDADLQNSLKDFKFLAQTCQRPGINVGHAEHKFMDKTYFHPGRVEWAPNPIEIKLVDIQAKGASGTDTNATLLRTFVNSGMQMFEKDNQFRTIGKDRAVNALGKVKISVLNSLTDATSLFDTNNPNSFAVGVGVAEQWELENAWLESVTPDNLDYTSEDLLTVTIKIRYDFCRFLSAGGTAFQPQE